MKQILVTAAVMFGLTLAVINVPIVEAQTQFTDEACRGANLNENQPNCESRGLTDTFKNIINLLIFIVGAISVLMLIIGGIRFAISSGNEEAVKGARNTILYAIIGIVVAFVAYAIVNFVIGRISGRG